MTLLSRLRAWLRPYPDDAEIQRRMLALIPQMHANRKAEKALNRRIDELHACVENIAMKLTR